MTMPTAGRAAMLRECRASGRDTQKNSSPPTWANHTGVAHGFPSPSAVASVMYALASTIAPSVSRSAAISARARAGFASSRRAP